MTCIAGISKGNTVWLGGDSAATDGRLNRTIISDPKVFVRGKLAFGVCGMPKVLDALAHVIELPVQKKGDTDRSFLVGELVPAIREGLKKMDCTYESGEYGTCFQGKILIGYRSKLYELEGNFQLILAAQGFMAVGSGGEAAMGSLRVTKDVRDPHKRIMMALQTSSEANAGVAPPFVVVKVKG